VRRRTSPVPAATTRPPPVRHPEPPTAVAGRGGQTTTINATQLFIDGRWIEAAESFDDLNPCNPLKGLKLPERNRPEREIVEDRQGVGRGMSYLDGLLRG
jgi:hypothetical protein